MRLKPGKLWRIFIVGRNGGEPKKPLLGMTTRALLVGRRTVKGSPTEMLGAMKLKAAGIRVLDLEKGTVEKVLGSHGFRIARWSPDGRWIAAVVPETHKLVLFDYKNVRWLAPLPETLLPGREILNSSMQTVRKAKSQ